MRKNRKPGEQALAHRVHRNSVGPRTIAPFPMAVPQYQSGPRRGQQLALIRKAVRL